MDQIDQNENLSVVVEEDRQENSVVRFLFENHGVRGEITHLHEPLKDLLSNHFYPKCVNKLMMQLASASILIAATLKANGKVTIQIQGGKGEHALTYAFINIDKHLNFYGNAGLKEGIEYQDNLSFKDLVGQGSILAISVFPEDGNRYQGIVSLDKDSLSEALEDYFKDSEQLATSFLLYEDLDEFAAGGIMLQIIPNIDGNQESLSHLTTLADTLSTTEITTLSLHECLRRLYWNDKVRVFDPMELAFKCSCSQERCLKTLESLGIAELQDMLKDQGVDCFNITCQSCGKKYFVSKEEIQKIIDSLETKVHHQDKEESKETFESQTDNDLKDVVKVVEQ